MAFSEITRQSVLSAIAEFDAIGREAFLDRYGFGYARSYFLGFGGRRYDSKAIVGAAHGYAFPDQGPLDSEQFSGGHATVQRLLESLGFTVDVDDAPGAPAGASLTAWNRWWDGDPEELCWLEITDRTDLGRDLNAPQTDDAGRQHWSYSLVTEANSGDVVFHYYKPDHAIVGASIIVGDAWPDTVVWGSHAPAARSDGRGAYTRDGWRRSLDQFEYFDSRVSLEDLRGAETGIRNVRDALQEEVSGSLYFPFELSTRRPLRPAQGYFTKFPVALARLFLQLESRLGVVRAPRPVPASPSRLASGAVYLDEDEEISVSEIDPFSYDPGLRERGLRGHARTQNHLAAQVRRRGLEPLRPRGEPNFDIAWRNGEVLFVAEVKSLTPANQEKQLRLGLGQVLRYRNLLESGQDEVVAVLAVEHEPSDARWLSLCADLGVRLVWPGTFEQLFIGDDDAATPAGEA